MIELKGVATYDGNFPQKNETNRKGEKQSTEFDRLFGANYKDMTGSRTVSEIQRYLEENITEPNLEFVTYDIFGKSIKLELFSGLNVNVEI